MLLVFCFGLGLYAMKSSIAPAIMSELFPTPLRGLGIGAWYNLTVALFGGRWSSSGSATSATAAGSSGMSRSAQPSRSSPH